MAVAFHHGLKIQDDDKMSSPASLLLLVPPEIRLHIYSFLLNDGNKKWLQIRNKPPFHKSSSSSNSTNISPLPTSRSAATAEENTRKQDSTAPPRRRSSSTYHVMERTSMFHRRWHETTYHLSDPDAEMHVAILSACRLTYHEASEVLYGRHGFDFDAHIEAVVPFLQDRTPYTRALLRTVSVYKRGPMPCLGSASERHEWSYMCRFLSSSSNNHYRDNNDNNNNNNAKNAVSGVKRLRLVVECGRPNQQWEGVQELTESDIKLLSLVGGHEVLEWVAELAKVQGLEVLEVVADAKYQPVPKSPAMVLYAALSASIEGGLAPFLRSEMAIPDGSGLK